jgi:hypothetical protein
MSEGYGGYARTYDGGGCLMWFIVFCLIGFGFMLAGKDTTPGGGSTSSTTSTVNRTAVEVMSRNQVNLLSNPQNCYGDNSCTTVIVSDTTTTVGGDRSTIDVQAGGGLPVCWDARLQTFTSSACQGGQP